MQASDGNLVLYSGSKGILSTKTGGHPGAHLDFQGNDGDLVLYDSASALWSSGAKGGATEVVLQDDCNLVTMDSSGAVLWSLGTNCSL
jgi:hypothetical protein